MTETTEHIYDRAASSWARTGPILLSDHTAISAPVFDHTGRILAGVTIMGHVNVLNDDLDGPVAERLRSVSTTVSREAGGAAHYLRDRL